MESGKVIHEGSGVRGSLGIPSMGIDSRPGDDSKTAAQTSEEAIASFPFSITAGLEKGSKNSLLPRPYTFASSWLAGIATLAV